MEASKKGRFQTFKDKTFKMWRKKRRRQALDKMGGVKDTLNSQLPPLSTSEDSEMSETTFDPSKPQYDQTSGTSLIDQSSATSGQWVKHSLDLSKDFFIFESGYEMFCKRDKNGTSRSLMGNIETDYKGYE